MGLLVAPSHLSPQAAGRDSLARLPGVTLHYVDWGGTGSVLLFLTGLGDSAHAFDNLAPQFTDRARVLGLTRRGQGQSEAPDSGYDPPTLASDIRAFLDLMGIEKVTLVGFSAAGSEMTYFAGAYPQRIDKLVNLDAANDNRSAYRARNRSPLEIPAPASGSARYARSDRPRLARRRSRLHEGLGAGSCVFCHLRDDLHPCRCGGRTTGRLLKRWEEYGKPFQHQRIAHFARDMRKGEVIELRDAEHGDFLQTGPVQTRTVREMRRFLFSSP